VNCASLLGASGIGSQDVHPNQHQCCKDVLRRKPGLRLSGAESVKLSESRKSPRHMGAPCKLLFFFKGSREKGEGSMEMIKTFGSRTDSDGLRLHHNSTKS